MFLSDETATLIAGEQLASRLRAGQCVYLQGDLGAGKTTLVRGVLRGLGHAGAVKSPTYTIVEPYNLAGLDVYHFDFYRLSEPEELEMIGGRDYFDGHGLCLVEWPDKARGMMPQADVVVTLSVSGVGRQLDVHWVDNNNEQTQH